MIENNCQKDVPFTNDQFPGAENSSKSDMLSIVHFARLFQILFVILLCCYYFTFKK